jgi:predicted DNA-binding transcriptional regulator AlpA
MPTPKLSLRADFRRPFDRVLSFCQWCELNGISERTGHRILDSGSGPKVLQLSDRRIGIRESDNARWQESCVRASMNGRTAAE